MQRLTRRQLLQWTGISAATLILPTACSAAEKKDERKGGGTYPFELPPLPYPTDALEPHIDARTMEIHHDRHHKTYVDGLNNALKGHPDLQKKTLTELIRGLTDLPDAVKTAVRNSGGGHLNHTMFWQMMTQKGGGSPRGELAKAIDEAFGSFDKFQEKFTQAALTRFGSGWAWLVVGKDKLEVVSTANQDNPLTDGGIAILGVDVWEHAYYLKYQNKRADYVKAWWNVVNWDDVSERFAAAKK